MEMSLAQNHMSVQTRPFVVLGTRHKHIGGARINGKGVIIRIISDQGLVMVNHGGFVGFYRAEELSQC